MRLHFIFVGGATEAAFLSWQSHLSRVAIASLYMLLYYLLWVRSSEFSWPKKNCLLMSICQSATHAVKTGWCQLCILTTHGLKIQIPKNHKTGLKPIYHGQLAWLEASIVNHDGDFITWWMFSWQVVSFSKTCSNHQAAPKSPIFFCSFVRFCCGVSHAPVVYLILIFC